MSIEAMKQALEFIEETNKSSSFWLVPASKLNQTVNALRQAIATEESTATEEPLFWYRPVCDSEMYEGPIHAKSVNGQLLRNAKPDEWKPLYTHPQPKAEQEPVWYQKEDGVWKSKRPQPKAGETK